MKTFAQLDPASLFIQFDANYLRRLADKDFRPFTDAWFEGDTRGMAERFRKVKPDQAAAAGFFATAFWHEQRHFLDYVLTGWGALRVRSFFYSYINFPELFLTLRESQLPVLLPIYLYCDPVSRKAWGVTAEPPRSVLKIAEEVKKRCDAHADDARLPYPSEGGCPFGAEAQFEALAWLSQCVCAQEFLGYPAAAAAEAQTIRVAGRNPPHIALLNGLMRAGLVKFEKLSDGRDMVDPTLLCSIIVASLCCRRQPPSSGSQPEDWDAYYPLTRWNRLVEALAGDGDKLRALPPEEVWSEVNSATHRLFGKDVIDEVRQDIAWEDGIVRNLHVGPEVIHRAWRDFHNLRTALFERMENDPLQIVDPIHYARKLAPELRPAVMLCSSQGPPNFDPNFIVVHGRRLSSGLDIWWSGYYKSKLAETDFALRDMDAWGQIAKDFAPPAKLLNAGRRHDRLVNQAELEYGIRLLRNSGLQPQLSACHRRPPEDHSPSRYFRGYGVDELVCDLCGKPLVEKDATVISRYDIEEDPRLARIKTTKLDPDDWSEWVVHRKCLE